MMDTVILDQKYIQLLSGRLKNFRAKGNGLFEFSHSCESADRRRGYFYKKGTGYNFFCHNCQESTKFFKFLKDNDPNLFKEYNVEVFKGTSGINEYKRDDAVTKEPEAKKLKTFSLDGITEAEDSPIAKAYMDDRKLPAMRRTEAFYTDHFYKWASTFYPELKKNKSKEQRLILPYIGEDGVIFGFTCRALGNYKNKYIELKLDDEEDMIFGLNHINKAKRIYVMEGPIDSMFIPNSVAVSGASYKGEFVKKYKNNIVIVPDNDWKRNKDVCNQVLKLAQEGYQISLLPDTIQEKDINQAICNGYSVDKLKNIIDDNVKSGPQLLLEIAFRRKC